MQLIEQRLMSQQIQALIRNKVEMECFMCMGQFDNDQYCPMIMCMNQHSCCAPCMRELLKKEGSKGVNCPHCQQPIMKRFVVKNRLLLTVYQCIQAYKIYVAGLVDQLEALRKIATIDTKDSLVAKSPSLVRSFIFKADKSTKLLEKLTIFDDFLTSRSQNWLSSSQKRRQTLQAYAERQKISQLKTIAASQTPFQQITKIRSGYGSIKKIECMQYFVNLKQLYLYNNHIKTIEGLNSNYKLNVLSLAYNRIQKVQNIGHLKDLKRLSLQCNKIGKNSAEYLALYEWKKLQSLNISFHQAKRQDNQTCFSILFSGSSLIQWSSLKTLYIYNTKDLSETTKTLVRKFSSNIKNSLQVYWS